MTRGMICRVGLFLALAVPCAPLEAAAQTTHAENGRGQTVRCTTGTVQLGEDGLLRGCELSTTQNFMTGGDLQVSCAGEKQAEFAENGDLTYCVLATVKDLPAGGNFTVQCTGQGHWESPEAADYNAGIEFGSVVFYETGLTAMCTLSTGQLFSSPRRDPPQPGDARNVPCAGHALAWLEEDGSLGSCILSTSHDFLVGEITVSCGGSDPIRDYVGFVNGRLSQCRLSHEQRFTRTDGESVLCLGGWRVSFAREGDRISGCAE